MEVSTEATERASSAGRTRILDSYRAAPGLHVTVRLACCDNPRPERGVPIDEKMPTSTVLRDLLQHASTETITLEWLMDRLGERSFGLVLLLLGLLAMLPGASVVAGILITVPAFQMVRGRHAPLFPRFLAVRSFKTRRLAAMLDHAVPPLRYLERYIQPRWQARFGAAKRLIGVAILIVGSLLFVPIPLSNVPPALVIVLVAFAYLEEDGVLLCFALAIILALLMVAGGAAWQGMSTVGWVEGLF